jgi:aryl-alcohol dehydrogenase-like predicted oxidoreductase
LGTATYGVVPAEKDVKGFLDQALDLGVNFLDTANSYGSQPRFDRPGAPPSTQRPSSEETIGRALKGRRHDVVIATKVQERLGLGPNDGGLSRKHMMQQVEESLRRLQTDYVDIYYAHHPDPMTTMAETMRAFDDLVRQGKVRYVALSNYAAWQMTEALWVCDKLGLSPPICVELPYNLVRREAEQESIPACLRFGVGVVAYYTFGSGLLAGQASRERDFIGMRRYGRPGTGFTDAQIAAARHLEEIASQSGIEPTHLALAWLLAQPGVASAIVGPEDIGELEAIMPGLELNLTGEQLAALDGIST